MIVCALVAVVRSLGRLHLCMGRTGEKRGSDLAAGAFPCDRKREGHAMSNELTRRSFVKWGAAAAGAATALAGLHRLRSRRRQEDAFGDEAAQPRTSGDAPARGDGRVAHGPRARTTAAAEHSRCLLRVYVEDGGAAANPHRRAGRGLHRGAPAPSLPARPRPGQQHDLAGAHQVPHEA